MPQLVSLSTLAFFALSTLAASRNLKYDIHKFKHTYQNHAEAQRLENARLLTRPSGQPAPADFLEAIPTTVDASVTGFQIYNQNNLPTNPEPPSACATALTSTIACNATIQLMALPFDADSLTAMCTPSCSASLESYRNNVVSSCNGVQFVDTNNATYSATLAIDYLSEAYFSQCRTDQTTGQFCSVVMESFTPTNPNQGILGYPQAQLCSSCMLGVLNTTLSSPATFSTTLYNTLQSALKTCGSVFASYNVSLTSPSPVLSSVPGATPLGSNITVDASCAIVGRNITVAANTTCAALSAQFSISQQDILDNNPALFPATCNAIPAQTELCLPQACTLYAVQTNQTCDDVVLDVNSRGLAGSQNITVVQLQSFNPLINSACTGLTAIGNGTVCITPHGGFVDLGNGGGSAVPTPTPTAVVPPPGQTAPGTTSACGRWYLVQPNNFCQQVALNNSITLADFQTLNPEINEDCTNLWANYYYCVASFPALNQVTSAVAPVFTANSTSATMGVLPLTTATITTPIPSLPTYTGIPAPTNVAEGTITNGCGYYYVVNQGDNCADVEEFFNMSDEDFKNFNDNSAVPCPSLTVGSAVCAQVLNMTDTIPPVPTNAASGSGPSGCAKWYTIVSGDGCASVEQKFSLSASQFFALNPEVKTDCTNLGLGDAYCVKAIGQTPGTGIPIPSNVVSGTDTQNCTKYDTVVSGDSCPAIEARNNVTDIIFRALNPEINSGCTNIQLGGAYCVKPVDGFSVVPGPPPGVVAGTDTKDCAKYDAIISGDTCPIVEARNGISDLLFRILNPEINAACTNIQLGGVYCVQAVPGFNATTAATTTTSTTATITTTTAGSIPTNIAAGSWMNCTAYYSVVSGDNCQAIDAKFNIAFSDFLRWNPEISTSCSNLQLSAYCVNGSIKCSKIYTVASGDFCSKIETENSLTDAQFRSLNPWLDTSCDLQIGQNMCVG